MAHTKKNETIFFFRSERTTRNMFWNPQKFYAGIVNEISYKDISIVPFVGVIDDVGNKLDVTATQIHDFEEGRTGRLIFEWDTIYDTSYYVRESELSDEEVNLIYKELKRAGAIDDSYYSKEKEVLMKHDLL
jgi:hypothetical protein